jgi:hypothetical protein
VKRDASIGESLKLAVQIHGTGFFFLKNRDSLHVKVAEHGVALPTAQETNEIAVDAGNDNDEGHYASGSQSFHCDIGGS